MAKLLLAYPPTADPTGPYLSIPYLVASARSAGHAVGVVDLNVLGYRSLLNRERLQRLAGEARQRFRALPEDGLGWPQAAEYLALSLALADADRVVDGIDDALAVMRDPARFYDFREYDRAVAVLGGALDLISARHYPLELTFTSWRTPFHLNDAAEIAREAGPAANPFYATYFEHLVPRLERERPDVLGISATFNAQLLQAFAIGRLVKEHFPGIRVVLGGTAPTQLVLRSERSVLRSLAPFADAIVLFEGETTLNAMLARVDAGESWAGLNNVVRLREDPEDFVQKPLNEDLDAWPAPDYSDLPLELYLAPHPLLYVAPTRGCYWEKCAFCHYGLTDAGTAPYRRRDPDRFVEDLAQLSARHGARFFYFAGDLVDPRYLLQVAERLIARGLDLRYTSDLRIERSFSAERCATLRKSGLLAAAFGTESDSPRLLALIEKGTDPKANRTVFENFANAGVAVQAMTFIDFPTETAEEATATLELLERNQDKIDLFFVEEFDLEAGSRVFRDPGAFGVKEVYFPRGDDYRLRARYVPEHESKRPDEYAELKRRMDRLARAYGRRPYPFAGSVSVAHTMFWFDRHGRDVFKRIAKKPRQDQNGGAQRLLVARPRPKDGVRMADFPYDLEALAEHVGEHAAELTARLELERRDVSRAAYEAEAAAVPRVPPRESYYLLPQDSGPVPIPEWVWMLMSCFTGETTVREAAADVGVPAREAAEAVAALLERGYLEIAAGSPQEVPAR